MKNIIKLIIIYLPFTILICFLFTNQPIIQENISYSLNLFITRVFPSLFPMFVISDILISLNLPYYLNKLTSKITYFLFNINGSSTYIFIMSLLSGTPSNAIITKDLLNKKYLSNTNATNILSFTLFSNPLFLYSMLTLTFSSKISLLLIFNNYLANILLGFILRNKNDSSKNNITYNSINLTTSIINAITKSLQTLMMILGTIVFFNLIKFNINNDLLNTIISCFIEITNGLAVLSTSNINYSLKIIIAAATISFTGLCIQIQIKSIINDTSINYSKFLKYRLIHLLLNCLLSFYTIQLA